MGIPRFMRWVAERWPCVCANVTTEAIPPTDNLFFNLNGILYEAAVHSGGHGDTEAILRHVEETIEKMVLAIKPKSVLFLAIDGVLPKAKIHRHRSSKFRTAENMKLASAAAARRGEILKTFDLNALTTGTSFMVTLMQRLKAFVQRKISQEISWPPKVIFSGSDVPGEADHKILDFIRNVKNSNDWIPDQRHGFYGLDAPTIMAALVIHEPHCYVFKEKNSKSRGNKGPAARVMLEDNCDEAFQLCSIGLMREYLGLEVSSQLPRSFRFDLERVVDDFVLFCMLAGNDFLPSIECFDGADALMENLMDSYKATLPFLGGYITQIGRINGERLQRVLDHCSDAEESRVGQRLTEMRRSICQKVCQPSEQDFLFVNNRAARDIFNLSASPDQAIQSWKERHYQEKLHIPLDEKQTVVNQYFEGLNWAMRCFYRGLPSWIWQYQHHYAPMISDMANMDPAKVLFRMGRPASSLFHLMSVIPSASHRLVPRILQPLIVDVKSPLAAFYPNDCRVDLEGKRMDWEAVVLLPPMDDRRLSQILQRIPPSRLTPNELERTKTGHALIFTSNQGLIRIHFCTGDSSASTPTGLGDTSPINKPQEGTDGLSTLKAFRSELPQGTSTGIHSPTGYWSLHSLRVVPSLKHLGVRLFSYPSERKTLQLTIAPSFPSCPLEALLDREVFVDWPSLCKARIVRVETSTTIYSTDVPGSTHRSLKSKDGCDHLKEWEDKLEEVSKRLVEKKGLDAGPMEVLVTVKKIKGTLRRGLDEFLERLSEEEIYPLQALVMDAVYANDRWNAMREQKLELSSHDRLLFVGDRNPGTVATILQDASLYPSSPSKNSTSACSSPEKRDVQSGNDVLVSLQLYSPEYLSSLRTVQQLLRSTVETYFPSGAVATRLGVTPQGLSRITGSLWINTGTERHEIGLAVKLGSKNMCVLGYVRPSSSGTGWEYTEPLIDILWNYKTAFPWVFKAVDATPEGGEINLKHVFRNISAAEWNNQVRRTKDWLTRLPLSGRPLVTAEAHVGSLEAIEEAQARLSRSFGDTQTLRTRLPRCQLVPPVDRSTVPSREAGGDMRIGDFVTYLGSSIISFGSPGIVIGTLKDRAEVLFSSRVLRSVSIFGDSTKQCSCLVNASELVNVSRILGEDRFKINHQTNRSIVQVARNKSMHLDRPQGHYSSSHAHRGHRTHWNDHQRSAQEAFPPPLALHESGCTLGLGPLVAMPAYGSGVYIAGIQPIPGMQGALPSHPMPYINYSMTPRF